MDNSENGLPSPKLEELPKIPESLAAEVHSPTHLKHVEIKEKSVLPSPEDVVQEKQEQRHDEVIEIIGSFDKTELKPTEIQIKIGQPSSEDLDLEKQVIKHDEVAQKIETFKTSQLNPIDTEVKDNLPTTEDLQLAKHQETYGRLNDEIESTEIKLKPTKTDERTFYPSQAECAQDKVRVLAAAFNKNSLQHVVPIVKHGLPSQEEYTRDKVKSLAAKFDHGQLKKVDTKESHSVEVVSNGNQI